MADHRDTIESIIDCAVNWISDDADNPVTPPQDWQEAIPLLKAAPDILDAATLALPYVEDADQAGAYKPGAVAHMVATIRAAIAKAEGNAAPAGWTHAETHAPDDPTQKHPALRLQRSFTGDRYYQLMDERGSIVAMLTMATTADAPAIAEQINAALKVRP